jgi:hypothetical protein
MTTHDLWINRDCGSGPWPLMLDTSTVFRGELMLERQCLGLAYHTGGVSGLRLRSLQHKARIKHECIIALEKYA